MVAELALLNFIIQSSKLDHYKTFSKPFRTSDTELDATSYYYILKVGGSKTWGQWKAL